MKNQISFLFIMFFSFATINAQNINQEFFNQADAFFKKNVDYGRVDYANLKNDSQLASLITTIENANLDNVSDATKKAFYINAYNIHVINSATKLYPTNSVQSGGGFFDRMKVKVAGKNSTLNNLEKQNLLNPYGDARLHFVLVCGALGCPPITDYAYQPDQLELQLEKQTTLALNNPKFIKVNNKGFELSQIFKWYASDFGGSKNAILTFINKYRIKSISESAKVSYYEYDWSLNDVDTGGANNTSIEGANAARYIVSSTIPEGGVEVKIFNNLYTQRTVGNEGDLVDRSTFFTTALSFLYGVNNRFNAGFVTRYRRVRNDNLPSNATAVFGSSTGEGISNRSGFTSIGPQIRYAPVKAWENFSIQSSFVFPIGEDLAGSNTQPYIDWNGSTWTTQLFNDFSIGNSFSLFTELDFILEDIGSSKNNHINRFSTPVTTILSYSPNTKTVLYALGGFSPYWQSEFDYFLQGGFGAKYQFTPNLELELLYTGFTNKFLSDTGGKAATYNVGFRFNL